MTDYTIEHVDPQAEDADKRVEALIKKGYELFDLSGKTIKLRKRQSPTSSASGSSAPGSAASGSAAPGPAEAKK